MPGHVLYLSLIVPVYNEEEAVYPFVGKINEVFAERADIDWKILFVNDGSTDETLSNLLRLRQEEPRISVIDLSRNFGKEAALTAGLEQAEGQAAVVIDVDLQDPPELILEMIAKWQEGFEMVTGRRVNRDSDDRFKRISASWFYRIYNRIAQVKLQENVGDFRLMDRKVIDALKQMPEACRFMKGLFAWAGFRTTHIDYIRPGRQIGRSKFNGWKLWNFALEGFTSFSTIPLRIWTYLGVAISALSLCYAFYGLLRAIVWGIDVPGYASLIVTLCFLGGLQLMGIGIIGEYLGRTYLEAKRRPPYLIRQIYKD